VLLHPKGDIARLPFDKKRGQIVRVEIESRVYDTWVPASLHLLVAEPRESLFQLPSQSRDVGGELTLDRHDPVAAYDRVDHEPVVARRPNHPGDSLPQIRLHPAPGHGFGEGSGIYQISNFG
jgi:hypothetical protein